MEILRQRDPEYLCRRFGMWMFRHGAVGLLFTKLISGEWRRALFVPTGALLSATSFHEGECSGYRPRRIAGACGLTGHSAEKEIR